MTTTKTPQEISALKKDWESDPCWDIEDTEGFEAHREELLAFSLQHQAKCEALWNERLDKKAIELGCPENRVLARYVEQMEARLNRLENRANFV
jgi:hypothetical protein